MEVPEMLQHWVPVPLLAAGFWWLLKRTFSDFEGKLGAIFGKLEKQLADTQEHDTKLQLLEQRVDVLERRKRR